MSVRKETYSLEEVHQALEDCTSETLIASARYLFDCFIAPTVAAYWKRLNDLDRAAKDASPEWKPYKVAIHRAEEAALTDDILTRLASWKQAMRSMEHALVWGQADDDSVITRVALFRPDGDTDRFLCRRSEPRQPGHT